MNTSKRLLNHINVNLFNHGVGSKLLMGGGVWYAYSRRKPGETVLAVVMPGIYAGYQIMKNMDQLLATIQVMEFNSELNKNGVQDATTVHDVVVEIAKE